jgi:hypothetical protein
MLVARGGVKTLIKYGGIPSVHTLSHSSIGARPSVTSDSGPGVRRCASVRFGNCRADHGGYCFARGGRAGSEKDGAGAEISILRYLRPFVEIRACGFTAYVPPEPDLSIKYHVLLGLPVDLPPDGSKDRPGDGFDAPASKPADVASNLVAEFRRHLKTCSKLPAAVAPSDKIKIKLRVFMTPEGKLAAEPVLIEASASAKGPALMQSAIGALEACQPYAMLPADRYGEWKVLDLSFTPQDFGGAS